MAIAAALNDPSGWDVGQDWLLPTKLMPPPARLRLVARPRLMERLAGGLRGPVTLVAAPAGSGKTTLLAEWRSRSGSSGAPLAWLSLDEGDNDPIRYWSYVVAALRRGRINAPAPTPRYVETLLAAFGEHAMEIAPATRVAPPGREPPLAEPLSEREVEVLRLITAGASNQEIARNLLVATSTVKTHVNRIFRKLDATSRTQAIARARALGLLSG